MCCSVWPAGDAGSTWATFNSPFKVTWSFHKLVNIFRRPCEIYLSTLVGWSVGFNSNVTVMPSVLSSYAKKLDKSYIHHLDFMWLKDRKKNMVTSPICPKNTAGSLSTPSFFTNQNVFDTNKLLLLNTTCHTGIHFPKMKQEKVTATLHLLHFSPVRLTLPSPCNIY